MYPIIFAIGDFTQRLPTNQNKRLYMNAFDLLSVRVTKYTALASYSDNVTYS